MIKSGRRLCVLFFVLILLFSQTAQAFDISADGAVTMNYDTGEIYYAKNADSEMVPASLTKIMTLYIVFEKMACGELSEDSLIGVSKSAAEFSRMAGVSNIVLKEGETLTLSTLIDSIAVASACASCTVLAEHISGSEAAFVTLMNQKAAELGIDAFFADASGLSDYNRITPRGVATLVCEFITRYPQILEYTNKTAININGRSYSSRNKLLLSGSDNYFYSGANGFKTGTTTLAGACIAATAQKDGIRIISVSMKSDNDKARYTDAVTLLDSAFDRAMYLNKYMFSTDIKTYIGDDEIPCCYALGQKKALCIIAEELNCYGFDTHYDSGSSTLYIYENPKKALSPLESKRAAFGIPIHQINKHPELKVVFVSDGVHTPLQTVFYLDGQCAISVDELGSILGYTWNDEQRTAHIKTP